MPARLAPFRLGRVTLPWSRRTLRHARCCRRPRASWACRRGVAEICDKRAHPCRGRASRRLRPRSAILTRSSCKRSPSAWNRASSALVAPMRAKKSPLRAGLRRAASSAVMSIVPSLCVPRAFPRAARDHRVRHFPEARCGLVTAPWLVVRRARRRAFASSTRTNSETGLSFDVSRNTLNTLLQCLRCSSQTRKLQVEPLFRMRSSPGVRA